MSNAYQRSYWSRCFNLSSRLISYWRYWPSLWLFCCCCQPQSSLVERLPLPIQAACELRSPASDPSTRSILPGDFYSRVTWHILFYFMVRRWCYLVRLDEQFFGRSRNIFREKMAHLPLLKIGLYAYEIHWWNADIKIFQSCPLDVREWTVQSLWVSA